MKKFFCFIYLACLVLPLAAQDVLSLDSCRTLAIANNKELLIGRTKIEAAHYQRKAVLKTPTWHYSSKNTYGCFSSASSVM